MLKHSSHAHPATNNTSSASSVSTPTTLDLVYNRRAVDLTLGLSNAKCDVDVTILHPTCHHHVMGASKTELHAAYNADHLKHKKHDLALMSSITHDALSRRMKVRFKSFVIETHSGLHPDARWLLRQISIRASGHHACCIFS